MPAPLCVELLLPVPPPLRQLRGLLAAREQGYLHVFLAPLPVRAIAASRCAAVVTAAACARLAELSRCSARRPSLTPELLQRRALQQRVGFRAAVIASATILVASADVTCVPRPVTVELTQHLVDAESSLALPESRSKLPCESATLARRQLRAHSPHAQRVALPSRTACRWTPRGRPCLHPHG